jgi:hypothetical protein
MTRSEIEQALIEAGADGWHYVANMAPPLGKRVEVMHILNRSYDNDGECDAEGKWHCSNGFILPNMLFTFNPTHWRDSDEHRNGEDAQRLSGEAMPARAEGIAQDAAQHPSETPHGNA